MNNFQFVQRNEKINDKNRLDKLEKKLYNITKRTILLNEQFY